MSNRRAASDPVEGFVWPSLGFHCNITSVHTENLSLLW